MATPRSQAAEALEPTTDTKPCQTEEVSFVGTRSWPFLASVGLHAVVATLLDASREAHGLPAVSRTMERDVWIGDTMEAPAPPAESVPAQSVHDEGEPPRTASTSRAASVHRASRPVEETPSVPRATDEEKSLAERILAYQPRSGSSESEKKDVGVAAERVHRATGGMVREAEESRARGFAKAFTRALPAANTGDPIWSELPLGPAGSVRVSVTVDADGTIGDSKVLDEPQKPPSHLARLVERTLILLRGGRFALTNGGTGTETLRLDVTLSERPMANGPLALGFEAPAPGNPGRAYFQLATGRFVEAKVTIERKS